MANKTRVTVSLSVAGDKSTAQIAGTNTSDQVGQHFVHETQVIGTSPEALDFGSDIADGKLGFLLIKNNHVPPLGSKVFNGNVVKLYKEIGATNEIGQVLPGQGIFLIPAAYTTGIYAKAILGSAQIDFLAVEL